METDFRPTPENVVEAMRLVGWIAEQRCNLSNRKPGEPGSKNRYSPAVFGNGEYEEALESLKHSLSEIVPAPNFSLWSGADDEDFIALSGAICLPRYRGWTLQTLAEMLLAARPVLLYLPLRKRDARKAVALARSVVVAAATVMAERDRLLTRGSSIDASTPKARRAKQEKAEKRLHWVLNKDSELNSSVPERKTRIKRISELYSNEFPGKHFSATTIEKILSKHRPIRRRAKTYRRSVQSGGKKSKTRVT